MPANVSYEYVKAEKKYNEAKTRNEKLDALEEMLSTVPKHKGTENLQAQIKSKIAKLKKQGESRRAGSHAASTWCDASCARTAPWATVWVRSPDVPKVP